MLIVLEEVMGRRVGPGVHPTFNQVEQRKEDSADCWVGPSCKQKEDQHLSLQGVVSA